MTVCGNCNAVAFRPYGLKVCCIMQAVYKGRKLSSMQRLGGSQGNELQRASHGGGQCRAWGNAGGVLRIL